MCSTPLDLALSEATVRLLESLASPVDAQVLGPQIMREITYRMLCGEHGNSLRALIALERAFRPGTTSAAADACQLFSELSISPGLAADASMSASAFHHHFKAVTATSPVQYLKTIRLHKARMLMVQEGISAGVAAVRVGYESTSQFSREFKRCFRRYYARRK